jgi:putative membrane protein
MRAAWDPIYRFGWLLENLLVFAFVPALVIAYRWHRFSDRSYLLLFVFVSLHVIGSHWTYNSVPWPDWGDGRNQYDRIVHFAYGLLLALPTREVLERVWRRRSAGVSFLTVEFLLATSALYEVIEWIVVLVVAPEAGAEFLGAQDDEFDAVADMALAGLGAVIAVLAIEALRAVRRRRRTEAPSGTTTF